MTETYNRTGPLMEATSYPEWAQQLIRDCSESKRRVVEHEIYRRMRDNTLSEKTMRIFLIGGWPVVEQFSLYMGITWAKPVMGAIRVRTWRGAGLSATFVSSLTMPTIGCIGRVHTV